LGLRHNFKGSMGVSYECTQDINCTSVYGTSASVMDYVDMNLPGPGVSQVDYFSRVIGTYDKLAIQYGYTDVEAVVSNGPPTIPYELRPLLTAAEGIPFCKDGDANYALDPTCMSYDFSSDPVYAFGVQLANIARAQSFAFEQAKLPGNPYWEYGDAAYSLANKAYSVGYSLLQWMGGFNISYVHVGPTPPIKPMTADLQRQALELILQVLRPVSNGFMPPQEMMRFLVQQGTDTAIIPLDYEGLMISIQTSIVEKLYKESTLENLGAGSMLGGLHVAGFLQQLGIDVFGFGDGARLTSQAAMSSEDWSLQSAASSAISTLECSGTLSQEIAVQVSTAATAARTAVQAALNTIADQAASNQPEIQACAAEGEACSCQGIVSYKLGDALFGSFAVSMSLNCTFSIFDIPDSVLNNTDLSTGMCMCLPEAGSSMDVSMGQLGLLKVHLESVRKALSVCSKAVSDDLEESDDLEKSAGPRASLAAGVGGLLAAVAAARL